MARSRKKLSSETTRRRIRARAVECVVCHVNRTTSPLRLCVQCMNRAIAERKAREAQA